MSKNELPQTNEKKLMETAGKTGHPKKTQKHKFMQPSIIPEELHPMFYNKISKYPTNSLI